MSFTELTEAFFAKAAGWDAVKGARGLLATGKVLSSNWSPPLLKGVVQEGTSSYRAGPGSSSGSRTIVRATRRACSR